MWLASLPGTSPHRFDAFYLGPPRTSARGECETLVAYHLWETGVRGRLHRHQPSRRSTD